MFRGVFIPARDADNRGRVAFPARFPLPIPDPRIPIPEMKLVECVPNFSEGRRPEIVKAIRDAIAAVEGVVVLDVSSDTSHNRTVMTLVVPVERAVDAAFAGIAAARKHIDLNHH